MYWFYRISNDKYYAYNDTIDNQEENEVSEDLIVEKEGIYSQYYEDWNAFIEQPAYKLGERVNDIKSKSNETLKDEYNALLEGCIQQRAFRNLRDPLNQSDYTNRVISWLEGTDFYTCPASTIYHESHPGGLLEHTLNVYNNVVDFWNTKKFNRKVNIDEAALCALVHDWCKIGLYQVYQRNVKDEQTGVWHQVDAYRRKSFDHPFGHGVSSMFMANRMFRLTEEESLAIRWHMGMFNVCDSEVNEYEQACEKYPLVLLLQFADHSAITEY